MACVRGHTEDVRQLLANKVNIEETGHSDWRNTPESLHHAWKDGDFESSTTPLQVAVEAQHLDIVEILIENNADISVKDVYGHSLLMLATLAPNTQSTTAHKIVELLIKHEANLEYTNPDSVWSMGETVLHQAAFHGKFEIVQVLVANGANIYARTKHDNTPKDLAKSEYRAYRVSDRLAGYSKNDLVSILESGPSVDHTHPGRPPTRDKIVKCLAILNNYHEILRVLVPMRIRERAMAMAMGGHERLGDGSRVSSLHPELIAMIEDKISDDEFPIIYRSGEVFDLE